MNLITIPYGETFTTVPGPAYVYMIGEENLEFVKIGYTGDLKSRLCTLQNGNPRKLYVIDSIKCCFRSKAESTTWAANIEKHMHKKFSEFKLHHEWYNYTYDMIEYFKEFKETVPIDFEPEESYIKSFFINEQISNDRFYRYLEVLPKDLEGLYQKEVETIFKQAA